MGGWAALVKAEQNGGRDRPRGIAAFLGPSSLHSLFIHSSMNPAEFLVSHWQVALRDLQPGSLVWGRCQGPQLQRSSPPRGKHSRPWGDVTWWPLTQHRRPPGHTHTRVPGRHSPEGGTLTLVFPPRYPCPSVMALLASPQLRPSELPDALRCRSNTNRPAWHPGGPGGV